MVLRVLGALAEAEEIGDRVLCGPARHVVEADNDLHDLYTSGQVKWVEARATPSSSVIAVMQSLPQEHPLLVVTADHALLNARLVDYFCSKARMRNADVVVGLAAYDLVAAAYPQMRRTVLRFRDGGVCGCNLYAFLTARGRSLVGFWGQVEALRKKPIQLISKLGWVPALGFVFGWLSLRQALAKLSQRLNLSIDVVMLPFPEAALDVDTVSDWELAQEIAGRKGLGR
jgi:GTP:adenosylcobinamide-phosphate guanylyltransferase